MATSPTPADVVLHQAPFWESRVLRSVLPVIAASRHVTTDEAEIRRVAGWMAYEEFTWPEGMLQFDMGDDPDHLIDVVMLVTSLNFAFTDFATSVKYEVDHRGKRWTDSEGMFASLHAAIERGEPILTGDWQAGVTVDALDRLFSGTIRMPMLEERAAILNTIGAVLVDRYAGRWSRFVRSCSPAMEAGGDGLLERLVTEFPRFEDTSIYDGRPVHLYKLAQLGLWTLHLVLQRSGTFAIADLGRMTAFADYIVPVALRLMGITGYTPELEARINRGEELPRDSEEEIEIRAHTLYATALLTEAINGLRPAGMGLVIPQVDHRLWKTYHATFWPHHLTRTTMY
jgi:hypothetical protein